MEITDTNSLYFINEKDSLALTSVPYFFSDQKIDEILQAIRWTATHAWKILPQYVFDCETGEWKHSKNLTYHDRRWLGDIRFTKEGVSIKVNFK